MSSICIIDTTVFCNILRIPNMDQDVKRAFAELEQYISLGCILLLPLAVVYETGNHIAQKGDGGRLG